MDKLTLVIAALGLYVGVTAILAWRGYRKTNALESFAVGTGDIPPWVVGLSLAAQLTSVATFVANPGLVFHYALAGLAGFVLSAAMRLTSMSNNPAFLAFAGIASSVAVFALVQWATRPRSARVLANSAQGV